MPQTSQSTSPRISTGIIPVQPKPRHLVRMFFASVFGSLALSLIISSILIVWLNRTLTDTNTYIRTVSPLSVSPDIQNYIAQKSTDTILQNAQPAEAAAKLLTPSEIAGKNPEQLRLAVRSTVSDSVSQIIRSQHFQTLWLETNRTAHAQLISQINKGSTELSLDLSPLISGVVSELKTTKLSSVSDQIVLPQDAGKINLSGDIVGKAHDYYRMFQTATLAIVGATILAIILSVVISVEHVRTIRRILMGTGIISLVGAILLGAPSLITLHGVDPVEQRAAMALISALFHDLRSSLFIIGAGCLALAIGSKLVSKYRSRSHI